MGFLSGLLLFPVVGVVLLTLLPARFSRITALLVSLLTFIGTVVLLFSFNTTITTLQFEELYQWIPSLGIGFHVGVDHLSILLVVLSSFLSVLAIGASYGVEKNLKAYYVCFLFLLATLLGVFVAHDLFLFYVFWELSLFPLYVIIALWGGERRVYAAIKMFLYTLFGSIFLLIGIILLSVLVQPHTFDLPTIISLRDTIPLQFQLLIVVLFSIGFAVKLPLVPVHTWLPDAHVEAPTAGSMLLAGVLLKMGGYGFLRLVFGLFPQAAVVIAFPLFVIGLVNIVYGAFLALAQSDLKKLVAYSSISHMGFVVIGLASLQDIGVQGALFQMIAHGITSPALFFVVGVLYHRTHSRDIKFYGGIATVMPVFSVLFALTAFASLGLPGLIGFIGEFATLAGGFIAYGWWVVAGGAGVFLAGMYMLKMVQGVLWGKVADRCKGLKDLTRTEVLVLVPLVVLMFIGGIAPMLLFKYIQPGVALLVQLYL